QRLGQPDPQPDDPDRLHRLHCRHRPLHVRRREAESDVVLPPRRRHLRQLLVRLRRRGAPGPRLPLAARPRPRIAQPPSPPPAPPRGAPPPPPPPPPRCGNPRVDQIPFFPAPP